MAHEEAERWNEAIAALKSYMQVKAEVSEDQLHFQTVEAYHGNRLGDLLRKTGRIDEAVVEYQRAVSILHDNLSADDVDGTPHQIELARRCWASNSQELVGVLHEIGKSDEAAQAPANGNRSLGTAFQRRSNGALRRGNEF